jgi:hypothetical protein
MATGGCHERSGHETLTNDTIAVLKSNIDRQASADTAIGEHYVQAYSRGIELLRDHDPMCFRDHPVVIAAVAGSGNDDVLSAYLLVTYLEQGPQDRTIDLIDEQGTVLSSTALTWTEFEADQPELKSTMFRVCVHDKRCCNEQRDRRCDGQSDIRRIDHQVDGCSRGQVRQWSTGVGPAGKVVVTWKPITIPQLRLLRTS